MARSYNGKKWEFTECTTCTSMGVMKVVFDIYSDDGESCLQGMHINDLENLRSTIDDLVALYKEADNFVAEEISVYGADKQE